MNRHDAGFTLLEMLVSIVVLGFLLVGLGQAVRFGLSTYADQTGMLARAGRQSQVNQALRRLIRQARQGETVAGTAHRLVLVSQLPAAAGGRIIDAAIYVDRRHQLVMAWTPHRFGVRLRAAASPRIEVLARGVASVSIGYWWPRRSFGAPVWQGVGPVGGLAGLVRVRVRPLPNAGRAWPELVAAPALAMRH